MEDFHSEESESGSESGLHSLAFSLSATCSAA